MDGLLMHDALSREASETKRPPSHTLATGNGVLEPKELHSITTNYPFLQGPCTVRLP